MIIKNLRAENVLKYARLELTNLPERATIAVTGPNESGKTAVGEAICLALFGRTYANAPAELVSNIKWGESNASLELELVGADGQTYVITRFLDIDGNHRARLARADSGELLAQGPDPVRAAVERVVGYDYDEYVDSFYLAQRESSLPHPQSQTAKTLLGMSRLETVRHDLESELSGEQHVMADLDARSAQVQTQLAELAVDPTALDILQAQRETVAAEVESLARVTAALAQRRDDIKDAWATLLNAAPHAGAVDHSSGIGDWREIADGLDAAVDDLSAACAQVPDAGACSVSGLRAWAADLHQHLTRFQDLSSRLAEERSALEGWLEGSADGGQAAEQAALSADLESAQASQGRNGMLGWLLVVVALLGWGTWLTVSYAPAHGVSQSLQALLARYVPGWGGQTLMLLAAVSGVLSLAAVWLLKLSARNRERAIELGEQAVTLTSRVAAQRALVSGLTALEDLSTPAQLQWLRESEDSAVQGMIEPFIAEGGATLWEPDALGPFLDKLHEELQSFEAQQLSPLLERIAGRIDDRLAESDEQERALARLDNSIGEEQARRAEAQELSAELGAIEAGTDQSRARARVREAAVVLIDGACRRIQTHFNREVHDLLGKVVPLLTGGHYEYLRLGESLEVEVFAKEKNDFVKMESLSSGTQRQLSLAVRLALAQALVAASAHGRQFLFLDEPFAFFDHARTRHTLETLPRLSSELSQIWVVAQEFERSAKFDLAVSCATESDSLAVDGP